MIQEGKKYWLNEYGERYWYKKSDMTIVAHRAYYWVDRIVFINEGSTHYAEGYGWSTGDRHHIGGDITYTEFKKQLDDWVPIEDHKEYAEMLNYFYKYNL